MDFNQLRKNLKIDTSSFTITKIALLGDSSNQLHAIAIKGLGVEYKLNVELYEADYDSLAIEVLNPDSGLYAFKPDFIVIQLSSYTLRNSYYKSEGKNKIAEEKIEHISSLIHKINSQFNGSIIISNYQELTDIIFNNFASKTKDSWSYQIRKLNLLLAELSQDIPNLFINDISASSHKLGLDNTFDSKYYISGDIVHSLDFIPTVAKNCLDIINSLQGKFNKCLILDLDNTLWGGIIGDDGIEGIQIGSLGIGKVFTELQLWAKNLKQRGIILCICSKNTESIAVKPFKNHPNMVLKMDDISVFVANWENKADNIRSIQTILNIGFDSMVFLDDNPCERNLIREELPLVTVPELPVDPAEYIPYLENLNLFETTAYSNFDNARTKKYQEEAKRTNFQSAFSDMNAYLESLNMKAEVAPFKNLYIPRISQLTQRSNQYNLRTIRYNESDINRITHSNNYLTQYISISDKFGDYGLVSLIIVEKKNSDELFIDTWLMSCRVLKRGVEMFALNEIVEKARHAKFKFIIGEHINTPKNNLVKNHYEKLGFEKLKENFWKLDIKNFNPIKNYISKLTEE